MLKVAESVLRGYGPTCFEEAMKIRGADQIALDVTARKIREHNSGGSPYKTTQIERLERALSDQVARCAVLETENTTLKKRVRFLEIELCVWENLPE